MNAWGRMCGWLIAFAVAGLLAWQIAATGWADHLATRNPHAALQWDAGNPLALAALARERLAANQPDAARRMARQLLREAPLQADGFAILAGAARAQGNMARSRMLYGIAARRAPRNAAARAHAIDLALREGNYRVAVHDIDVLLRLSPQRVAPMVPLLARLAVDPRFADALAHALAQRPPWRGSMLDALFAHGQARAVDQVMGALQRQGGLADGDFARWLDWLTAQGRWGEAYGLWAGRIGVARLPLVYDGDFARAPTGAPFDWDMRGEPGVLVERVQATGRGTVAQVSFLDRRAQSMHFDQALLLAPGRYRLRFQARAQMLESASGVDWIVECSGGTRLGTSAALQGSFDWRSVQVDFAVPSTGCEAQRLALDNPGPAGAGKIVSGTLWVDDFAIVPLGDAHATGARTPDVAGLQR